MQLLPNLRIRVSYYKYRFMGPGANLMNQNLRKLNLKKNIYLFSF